MKPEDKKPENLKCPVCKGPMKSRQNRTTGQFFWGCADFPKCKGTRDTDGLSKEDKQHEDDNYSSYYDK